MTERGGSRISPAEAYAKMTNEAHVYVDVRTAEEFAAGHPGGAFNVPVMIAAAAGLAPNPEFVAVMERAFAKDTPIIVGCKMGGRSARAAKELALAGFTRVLDQRAGWDGARGSFGELTEPGWSRAGLPTETGAPADRSYEAVRAR
jgi:rhodanese-related sulfurtransferase